MRIIISIVQGGGVPRFIFDYFGYKWEEDFRTDENFMYLIENPENVVDELKEYVKEFTIVEIPDESTDWDIVMWSEYETVVFVVNGKLGFASS